ncbi:MAG: class II fumarate hydratase [Deltaproteobacteria bacterium]|nr:class II fumarate hydratase [Deltaproteobacteria bacterium]
MYRVEKDPLGEILVDENCLWGAHTQRAFENFQISSFKVPQELLQHLALVKFCYASTHKELNLLPEQIADAIADSAHEIYKGAHFEHFPLDVFQTGSATSTNMNMNEVIANLSLKKLGYQPGNKDKIHPNDHVNMSQSSNDVIPSAILLTSAILTHDLLLPSLENFIQTLKQLELKFADIIKLGRTHLQDAVPLTVGQEISGWRAQLEIHQTFIKNSWQELLKLPVGGTAVGTGLNCDRRVPPRVIEILCQKTNLPFCPASNNFSLQSSLDPIVGLSSTIRSLAVAVHKICNDLRHLSSGPRGGIGEYVLPVVQAGSSIMPGKSNPVILESAIMAMLFVISLDTCICLGGMNGNFQLNTSMPLLGFSIVNQIKITSNTLRNLIDKVFKNLGVDADRCLELVEKSPALCTPLAKLIGYDRAAEVFQYAVRQNLTIREAVKKMGLLDKELSSEELNKILDPKNMV